MCLLNDFSHISPYFILFGLSLVCAATGSEIHPMFKHQGDMFFFSVYVLLFLIFFRNIKMIFFFVFLSKFIAFQVSIDSFHVFVLDIVASVFVTLLLLLCRNHWYKRNLLPWQISYFKYFVRFFILTKKMWVFYHFFSFFPYHISSDCL